jgi:hypothetical protein
LSMRSAGSGFGMFLCEYHQARLAKHGHAEVPNVLGPTLKPYRETAQRWINAELAQGNVRIQGARTAIWGIMQTSGNVPAAMDTKRWSAEAKAKAAWARLREAPIDPSRILASHTAMVTLLADDTWAPRSHEYVLVQSAKAIHRLASGTHRDYAIALPVSLSSLHGTDGEGAEPPIRKASLHVYPRSQGQVLRVMGTTLDEVCGSLAEDMIPLIIAQKEQRYGRHPCHTPGYEPEWRKQDRAKHEAALRAREQAQAEAQRQENVRQLLSDVGPALSWQHRR